MQQATERCSDNQRHPPPFVVQSMLAGEKKLIGNGNIRDVYLVEWRGRKLVVKALREDFELTASRRKADKIHRWEAAALDEVSE